jgi:integrase
VKTTKTFFNWLVKLDVLSASPAKQMKMKRLDRFVNREKAMTDEELSQILEYLEWRARYQKRTRDLSLVTFLADSACRAGGAAGLREDWLDLDNLEAVVREKGDKTRTVWYMHRAARSLRMWLIQRSASSGPYVFSNHAEPVTSATVSQIVRRACKAVGIRSLGAHSLRHRKGHQMNAMGISPAIAAIVLGHDNPQTTMDYYYDYTSETAREVVMKLGLPEQPTENNIIRFHSRKGS